MDQPHGNISKGKKSLICKLFKTLYGLKLFPRAWYKKIDEYFNSQSLKRSHENPNIYILRNTNGFIIIIFYVDDLIIVCNNKEFLSKTKDHSIKWFEVKSLK